MEEKKTIVQKGPAPSKKTAPKQSGSKAWSTLKAICSYLWKYRGIIISVPVLVLALGQAFRNAAILPEKVGLNIQATGEYAMMVTRSTAVVAPLMITLGCILLTCFTKRPLFPWLISIFTLVLPLLIWVINVYPV